jgi:hypothetical protein
MTWCKLQAGIRTNGKIGEAGPDGALLFIALLSLHTDRGAGGLVPASCCRPSRLRIEAVALLGTFDVERIDAAIEACVRAELCARRADGAIELRGWSDDHAVACSHCRKPNPEPSHKTCPTCRDARKADREPSKQAPARRLRAHGARRAQIGVRGAHLAALDSDSDSDSDVPPTPKGVRADARGADAARRPEPEPEPERARPPDDGASPIADLTTALMATRYRAGIGNAIARRAEVRERAAELVTCGMTLDHLAELVRLADAKSNGDPGALLAHWLDGGDWRGVLAEAGMKAKESAAKARGRAAQSDDVLEGVYGGDQPQAAGDVVGQVLQSAASAKL